MRTLAEMSRGDRAVVSELTADGKMRRRLQDVGLIPGTRVECVQKSPLGDPTAYLIRGAVIALRRQDAARVLLNDLDKQEGVWCQETTSQRR